MQRLVCPVNAAGSKLFSCRTLCQANLRRRHGQRFSEFGQHQAKGPPALFALEGLSAAQLTQIATSSSPRCASRAQCSHAKSCFVLIVVLSNHGSTRPSDVGEAPLAHAVVNQRHEFVAVNACTAPMKCLLKAVGWTV